MERIKADMCRRNWVSLGGAQNGNQIRTDALSGPRQLEVERPRLREASDGLADHSAADLALAPPPPGGRMTMTPAKIIKASHVPGTHSVFFLGCFEKRVTLYSQQVRALNLVAAILDQRKVRPAGRVAIVGGGAAGITTAVAFAKAAPELEAIDVYEVHNEVLHLQQSSKRFLHPHIYDWPDAGSDNPVAGLPILNWTAGPANEVQRHLLQQFDEAKDASLIELHASSRVERLVAYEQSLVRVDVQGRPGGSRDYDAVILAGGFGLERSTRSDTPSY